MSIDRNLALRENMSVPDLMKRYGLTGDMLDLLALQRAQSKQAAAMRENMTSLEQQPGTIKAQKEQELLNMSRDEVAQPLMRRLQQSTAAEQQKQLQQQRAMQALAQAMQQRGGPQSMGLAGVPAPNMRMAEGGIVGYAGPSGSLVTTGPLTGVPSVDPGGSIEDMELYKSAKEEAEAARTALKGAYSGTPEEERREARDEAAEFLRREQMRRAEQARIAELRRAMARTPEELQRERQRGFLLGAAGTSKGYTGAAASRGLQSVLDAQRAEKISNLEKLQEMARGMEARDVDIGTQGLMSGRTAEEQRARGLGTLATTTGQFRQTAANVAESQIGRRAEASEANQQAVMEGLKAAAEQGENALEFAANDIDRLTESLNRMEDNAVAQLEILRNSNQATQDIRQLQSNLAKVAAGEDAEPVLVQDVDGKTIEINSMIDYEAYLRRRANAIAAGASGKPYDQLKKELEDRIDRLQKERDRYLGTAPGLPGVSGITVQPGT